MIEFRNFNFYILRNVLSGVGILCGWAGVYPGRRLGYSVGWSSFILESPLAMIMTFIVVYCHDDCTTFKEEVTGGVLWPVL